MTDKVETNWLETTLGAQLSSIVGGGTPPRSEPSYWDGQIPWVSVKDLDDSRVINQTGQSITEDGLRNSSTRVVSKGTLLLVTRMAVGRTAFAGVDMAINQDLKALLPKDSLIPIFMFHFLRWKAHYLQSKGAGTTVDGVGISTVRGMQMMLPPLDEQRAIAAILDSIDNAIERTEEVIAATENLRKALLQNLLTNGVPGWHTEWKEVPGIGRIPADWEVVQLGDCIEGTPTNGLYKPENAYGSGTWLIRINDFTFGRMLKTDMFNRVEATEEEQRIYGVRESDILINRVNSVSHLGKSVLLPPLQELALFESNMMRVRTTKNLHPRYLIAVLTSSIANHHFIARAKKAVQQVSINQQDVNEMRIPLPSLVEQELIIGALDAAEHCRYTEEEALLGFQVSKRWVAESLLSGQVPVEGEMTK